MAGVTRESPAGDARFHRAGAITPSRAAAGNQCSRASRSNCLARSNRCSLNASFFAIADNALHSAAISRS